MYCPRCGHQPISDAMRFCSYCGFKLGVVKASLADDDSVSAMDQFTIKEVPKERQRDINIGVFLMFAGAALAGVLAGRGGYLGREGGALILAAAFLSILLFSRPILKFIYKLFSWEEPPAHSFSVNQRRMAFGSILMFTSTILLAISSLLMLGRMRTPEFFLGLFIAFVLLLIISRYLMKALRYLVGGNAAVAVVPRTDEAHDPLSVVAATPGPALSAGQDVPVSLFTSQRVTTAEILTPASITEQTTNLLENK
jgi:zinc ribbon protein